MTFSALTTKPHGRVLAALVVAWLGGGHLAQTVHDALVEHVRCAEHGEWVHTTAAPPQADDHGPGVHETSAQPAYTDHAHCPLGLCERLFSLRYELRPAAAAHLVLAFAAPPLQLTPSTSIHRIAPKTSPPA